MEKNEYTLLSQIKTPTDLRKLSVEQLPQVCQELRDDIIKEVSVNPGHFASSLGVVEITVALHYVFNTPEDRLVWDVGHQAYGHKILTGRRESFCTNRKLHGLHPFPTPLESEYDSFTCGHASNSISAALGMAVANAQHPSDNTPKVVAIIGDGAMSGGLAFEGLNNASSTPNDLLIVLNDNDMSIDHAVGGMEKYLLSLDANETYNRLRFKASQWLKKRGMMNDNRRKGLIRLNNALKSALAHQQNIFEGMNIRYIGPYDGHNVVELVRVLQQLKDMKGPKLLHLHTKKGKGYKPAEESATVWHAPGKFDPETGERIVGVTPAMPTGCSMNIMMEEMPERTFDVGIAEGHAVTFSAGMAKEGLQPFCNIYSAFAQRAYDNIIHDAALLSLPVVLCLDRAGLVGEDGPTHHGAFDMAALRPIPNLTIASPLNERELVNLMYTAQLPGKGTFVIRYPRGCGQFAVDDGEKPSWEQPFEELPIGKGQRLADGNDVAVLSIGPIGNHVTEAIESLQHPTPNTPSVAHYDLRFLKPLDEELLHEVGQRFNRIITVEDGTRSGGMGSAVVEWMCDHGYKPDIVRLGLPDHFVEHGSVAELQHIVGIDAEAIRDAIIQLLSSNTQHPTTPNTQQS